jgi:uncharacterized protein YjiS (DUF1127 family)
LSRTAGHRLEEEDMTTATRSTSFISAAFEVVATQLRTAHKRRSQRIALLALMDMDAGRLDDLGLSVSDVMDALQANGRR